MRNVLIIYLKIEANWWRFKTNRLFDFYIKLIIYYHVHSGWFFINRTFHFMHLNASLPCPPCRFFGRCIFCILTGRDLKLILYEFSSNFILNIWPVKFFWSLKIFAHTDLFVCDRRCLSLIMELSIHCYTALVLEIRYKSGCSIVT